MSIINLFFVLLVVSFFSMVSNVQAQVLIKKNEPVKPKPVPVKPKPVPVKPKPVPVKPSPPVEIREYTYWMIKSDVNGILTIDGNKKIDLSEDELARVGMSKGRHNLVFTTSGGYSIQNNIVINSPEQQVHNFMVKDKVTGILKTELGKPKPNWSQVRISISAGADFDPKSYIARKAVNDAAASGSVEGVKILLESGVDANADYVGTPLINAAKNGKFDVAKLLIKQGAKVNTTSSGKWTALLYASNNGYLDIVKLLLENGADVTADDGKNSALDYAKNDEIKRLLRSYGAE